MWRVVNDQFRSCNLLSSHSLLEERLFRPCAKGDRLMEVGSHLRRGEPTHMTISTSEYGGQWRRQPINASRLYAFLSEVIVIWLPGETEFVRRHKSIIGGRQLGRMVAPPSADCQTT